MPNRMRTSRRQPTPAPPRGLGPPARRPLVIAALLLLGLLTAWPGAARAQEDAPTAPAPQVGAVVSEIQLSADQFGVGNVVRAGGWIGLRVRFRDDTDRPRDIILEVEMRDADGDRPVYRRVVTANPGRFQQAWLYVYLPYEFDPSRGLRLRARDVAGESGETAVREGAGVEEGARRGRLLAETIARPVQILQDYEGALGVIGGSTHGLSLYASSISGNTFSPLAHERTEVVGNLAPLDLPDRWMGLAPFETLVWSGGDPAELGPERARALREWIERGGHLVIMLSVQGQGAWTTSANNLLRDLFPGVEVRTSEGVDLESYRPLLLREPRTLQGLPARATIHTFEPLASAGDQEAIRVLDGPGGECVAARRLVGLGMVTAVGMGAASAELNAVGLPAADVFWNRILGRRGQFETLTRLNQLNSVPGLRLGGRDAPVVLDRGIDARVNLVGQSLAGLVLAFAVFGLYWLVAGPGGFAALRKTGSERHAWVAFVGAAALFTAIAWGGATIIKPKRVEVRHITVLDHVYGQEVDRARSWLSVLIPSYLGAEVSLDAEEAGGLTRFHQLVSPWEARPDADLGGPGGGASFPDARAYEIESRQPSTLRVPTRATVKQFQVDWAGAPRLAWPVPAAAGPDSGPGRILLDPATRLPVGVLTHALPAPLRDVQIIVVRQQTSIRPWRASEWVGQDGAPRVLTEARTMIADAIGVSVAGDWAPGQPMDLAGVFAGVRLADLPIDGWLGRAAGTGVSLDAGLRFASLFHQLMPPEFSGSGAPDRFERTAMHGLDLSRWFGQPCIIVLGTLEMDGTDALQVPLGVRVAGESRTLHTRGATLVRWIYPLPSSPPTWAAPAAAGEEDPEEQDDQAPRLPRGVSPRGGPPG